MVRKGVLALLLSGGLAWALTLSPAAAQKPRAERPTFSVGERWLLNDGVYDLITVKKDLYIFVGGTGRQIHLTKNLGVTTVLRDGLVEWDIYPPPDPGWPLEVGKWGVVDSVLRNRDYPGGITVRATWEVKAHEPVQVVAGAFKAFRIVYDIKVEMGSPFERFRVVSGRKWWNVVTWYAPEARAIVKAQAVGIDPLNFHLVALDRPSPAPLQVTVQEPGDKARVATERLLVSARVTSGAGVARVSVTLNAMEVVSRDERGAPDVTLAFPVTLREGENVLLVTATDVGGTSRQEGRVVFYERATERGGGSPPAARPAPPPAPSPSLQLVISSPGDQAHIDHESTMLVGFVSGGTGARQVLVTLNGVEVSRVEGQAGERPLAINVPLRFAEGRNTLVVTAMDTRGETRQAVQTIYHERAVPLTIEVRHPEDRARVTEPESTVAALARSSRGVVEVGVFLNGAKVFEQRERAPQKSLAVAAPVKLREGTNVILVSGTDADGAARQEIRTIVYERPAARDAPEARPLAKRERWAVVIGVGQYESPQIPGLRYSLADAEAFYNLLVNQGGFKKENVLLLTDRTERKPTLRNIKWALGTFLARSAKKEDLVVVFFAGHGAPEVDPRGVEPDGLAKYLVPADADPGDLYATALPMDEFQIIFHRIEAEQVVVFLDSCYSGAAGGRTFASRRTRAVSVDDVFLERLTRSKGRAVVTASRPAEVSIELPELGHGIFTYYLLQGLRGTADLDRDGIVSLQELYQFVEQKVVQKSRAEGGNQHPMMKGEMEGSLPLVRVGR